MPYTAIDLAMFHIGPPYSLSVLHIYVISCNLPTSLCIPFIYTYPYYYLTGTQSRTRAVLQDPEVAGRPCARLEENTTCSLRDCQLFEWKVAPVSNTKVHPEKSGLIMAWEYGNAGPSCQSLAMLDLKEPLFHPPRVQLCQTLG